MLDYFEYYWVQVGFPSSYLKINFIFNIIWGHFFTADFWIMLSNDFVTHLDILGENPGLFIMVQSLG